MTPTPGRDELREQIAAVLLRHGHVEWTEFDAGVVTDAVLPVVDTWVAAHTEQGAEDEQVAALRAEGERWHYVADYIARERDAATAAVARVRALCDHADHDTGLIHPDNLRAALPPTEGQT